MESKILVIGSSGTVGSEVVKNLTAQGHKVRTTTSKKSTSQDQVHLNLLTGEGLREAFEGIDKAFFLSPAGYTNQSEILGSLIEESKRRKLKKVVLMSAMGANASPDSPLRQAEIALEQSGLVYNIIRPNWFLQNFNSYWIHDILTQGKIMVPAGEAKVSFIDARDIARVAAKLLTTNTFDNQDFDLTGPEAIDHHQAAAALSKVIGKKISYQEVSPAQFKENVTKGGLSADYADVLNYIFTFLKQGYAERTTDSVQKVTGVAPTGVDKYANDYRNKWL